MNEQNDLGQLPPQNIDAEETVLGSVILEKEAILEVYQLITVNTFYKQPHQFIWEAITALFSRSEPIDLVTVTQELREQGNLERAGGPLYVTRLTSKVSSSANLVAHTMLMVEASIRRDVIAMSSKLMKDSYNQTKDPLDSLSEAQTYLMKASDPLNAKSDTTMEQNADQMLAELKLKMENKAPSGIEMDIKSLDKVTGGWMKSSLIVVAGRPGMGKTALVIQIIISAVKRGHPVGVCSPEMSKMQLTSRLVSNISGIPYRSIDRGHVQNYEMEQIEKYSNEVGMMPIHLDESVGYDINQLRAKAYRMKVEYGIKLLILDYIQLLSPTAGPGSRENKVAEMSRGLKIIAKELEIPVIALSQLSRAVEQRGGDRRPQLSDLRESGAIEQDADQVIFLYRPEYYGIMEDEEGNSTEGLGMAIVAKNRSGSVEDVSMKIDIKTSKFTDSTRDYGQQTPEENGENRTIGAGDDHIGNFEKDDEELDWTL